jgi:Na+/H+-dicarboxylate symporter
VVTISAVALALVLGMTQAPFVQYLRPVGDFYLALLQMCVLPFLLTTIPLAVRSAMTSGTVGHVVWLLAICVAIAIAVVAAAAIVVPTLIFHFFAIDEGTLSRIGAFLGGSADRIEVEFLLDPVRGGAPPAAAESGLLQVVPTNIFASLASNDSMRVLVFAGIFGVAMVMTERQLGRSIFGALQYVQAACIMIFDWFGLLMPVGIVALIAPQVALMGSEIFSILAVFAYAFFAVSALVLTGVFLVVALSLRLSLGVVFASLLRPMMLGAATRNTLVCIPLALEIMKDELKVAKEPCDLFIPVGFATLRFGTILYFIIATLFMGTLLGRSFSTLDVIWVAVLSTAASFATLGVTGLAALTPLAAVLRPFGLSYEVAVPLMVIVDPIANMIRVMVNVAVNCAIPALAGGRDAPAAAPTPVPAE